MIWLARLLKWIRTAWAKTANGGRRLGVDCSTILDKQRIRAINWKQFVKVPREVVKTIVERVKAHPTMDGLNAAGRSSELVREQNREIIRELLKERFSERSMVVASVTKPTTEELQSLKSVIGVIDGITQDLNRAVASCGKRY